MKFYSSTVTGVLFGIICSMIAWIAEDKDLLETMFVFFLFGAGGMCLSYLIMDKLEEVSKND